MLAVVNQSIFRSIDSFARPFYNKIFLQKQLAVQSPRILKNLMCHAFKCYVKWCTELLEVMMIKHDYLSHLLDRKHHMMLQNLYFCI